MAGNVNETVEQVMGFTKWRETVEALTSSPRTRREHRGGGNAMARHLERAPASDLSLRVSWLAGVPRHLPRPGPHDKVATPINEVRTITGHIGPRTPRSRLSAHPRLDRQPGRCGTLSR